MIILAVSDAPSRSLENLIEKSPRVFKDIGMIVSCGDLDREYLEFLAEGTGKELFFVAGNHPGGRPDEYFPPGSAAERVLAKIQDYGGKLIDHIAGRGDLHGRVEAYGEYLVAGFGGSRWYNGGENQYTERQMERTVGSVKRRIAWHRLRDRVLRRPRREVIVISHAPPAGIHDQPDPCHTGFKCFRDMAREISPILWIHGHIHLQDARQGQVSVFNGATVVNAYGCRIIEIGCTEIQVYSHHALKRG